jgi:hypothetical protein
MSHNFRTPLSLSSPQAGDASSVFRTAALPLLLVVFVALAAATLAGLQLRTVEKDHLPALRDAQTLDATAAVTGAALRSSDFVRADSLAQRFHAVAGIYRNSEAKQNQMRSYDASFVDYYVDARRVAAGTSMSEEADLSSSESAKLAKGILKERLDTGMAADRKAVESTSVAAMKLRVAVGLLFALCAGVALYLLKPRRRIAKVRVAEAPAAPVVKPLIKEEHHDGDSHLQEAVRRMAERRKAVAVATAQVAERNRQQVALLQEEPAARKLTVIRGDSQVSRTRVNSDFQLGKRALVGA